MCYFYFTVNTGNIKFSLDLINIIKIFFAQKFFQSQSFKKYLYAHCEERLNESRKSSKAITYILKQFCKWCRFQVLRKMKVSTKTSLHSDFKNSLRTKFEVIKVCHVLLPSRQLRGVFLLPLPSSSTVDRDYIFKSFFCVDYCSTFTFDQT